jgi:hypothetical protein
VLYVSQGPGSAYRALAHASKLDPTSYFIPRLLRPAKLASGPEIPLQGDAARAAPTRQPVAPELYQSEPSESGPPPRQAESRERPRPKRENSTWDRNVRRVVYRG